VALAETGFTFTTAINSRAGPELAAEIHSEVALPRDLWLRAQSKLNAVDAAIQDFQTVVGQRHSAT
jgi:hypothetical protein